LGENGIMIQIARVASVVGVLVVAGSQASAQSPAEFFKDKTLTF
jgi:hypothetical protein